jgi:2-(1,2-epoxy-1,2-dihydrophenyl)acetyl-CoA isomerase
MAETVSIPVDTGTDELLCRIERRVMVVTLNRPEARNALSDRLTPALRQVIRDAATNVDVRALLITGAGAAFCAGGDVKGMGDRGSTAEMTVGKRVARLIERQRTLTGALVGLRKPTIAALPGPAAGAGLSLALACDIRIAAANAFVSTAYARIGLSGDYGISWLLIRAVGPARARELLLLSERIDAQRCAAIGLFNRVVAPEDLVTESTAMALKLADGPIHAYGAIKDNLDEAPALGFSASLDKEAERLVRSSQTDEHREAVRAFIEKRPVIFR